MEQDSRVNQVHWGLQVRKEALDNLVPQVQQERPELSDFQVHLVSRDNQDQRDQVGTQEIQVLLATTDSKVNRDHKVLRAFRGLPDLLDNQVPKAQLVQ